MKHLRRVVAVGGMLVIGLCGWVRGQQALEQVPSKAVGVFEVKDLQGLSAKLAKFAKSLGIDQFDPRWADPLASLMDEFDLKQGVNKAGDLAIAMLQPEENNADAPNAGAPHKEPEVVVIVPTSDYQQFLGNFDDVKDQGDGISQVTVKKNKETLFVTHRGEYAVASMKKEQLSDHGGLKLQGSAAKEAQSKDAILYFDIKALRPLIRNGMKEARKGIEAAQKNPGANPNPFGGQMPPEFQKIMEMEFNAVDAFVKDARTATISLNLNDTGIAAAAMAEFEPDSYLGRMVEKVQNTDESLLSGLPKATYFAFGGMKLTPEVAGQLFSDFMEPLKQDLATKPNGQKLVQAFDAAKQAITSMKEMAIGYAAPAGPNEGFIETIGVAHGDAQKILKAQKEALPSITAFMGMSGAKNAIDVTFGQPVTVQGAQALPYTMKFNFAGNDAQSMQAQQMISMMYGRNGLKGWMTAVNDDTFVSVQGGGEQILGDAIAAAKNNSNAFEQAAHIKQVSSQLPKQRAFEFYIALDNIANGVVKMMKQQGVAVQFKLPPNLPPIGISSGTEGSTARLDAFIPTQLVQSVTAAAMQTWMQMNGGAGGQGGGI